MPLNLQLKYHKSSLIQSQIDYSHSVYSSLSIHTSSFGDYVIDNSLLFCGKLQNQIVFACKFHNITVSSAGGALSETAYNCLLRDSTIKDGAMGIYEEIVAEPDAHTISSFVSHNVSYINATSRLSRSPSSNDEYASVQISSQITSDSSMSFTH